MSLSSGEGWTVDSCAGTGTPVVGLHWASRLLRFWELFNPLDYRSNARPWPVLRSSFRFRAIVRQTVEASKPKPR